MLDVCEQARNEHEVDGAITHHLVGDMDIAGLRVPRLWCHTASLRVREAVDDLRRQLAFYQPFPTKQTAVLTSNVGRPCTPMHLTVISLL
jgi:hypothetical protein